MARSSERRHLQPRPTAMPGRPQPLEESSPMMESLRTALNCNRRLQEELQKNVVELRRCQVANRKQAVAMRQEAWEQILEKENDNGIDEVELPPTTPPRQVCAFYQALTSDDALEGEVDTDATATRATCSEQGPRDDTNQSPARAAAHISRGVTDDSTTLQAFVNEESLDQFFTAARRNRFRQPSNKKKWNVDYFMDPLGFRPAPNQETQHRLQLRSERFQGYEELVPALDTATTDDEANTASGQARKQKKSKSDDSPAKFSKDESNRLLEELRKWQASARPTSCASNPQSNKWEDIAESLNDTTDGGPTRSAWQCYCHFKRVLEPRNLSLGVSSPLDAGDDKEGNPTASHQSEMIALTEFLFRYFAMQGPQFVWDISAAVELSHSPIVRRLTQRTQEEAPSVKFGSFRHLLSYANQLPAINPNMVNQNQDYWDLSSERKIVLLMKIYHCFSPSTNTPIEDSSVADNQQAGTEVEARPRKRKRDLTDVFTKVASHFPNRGRLQVVTKWKRSLDPTIDQELFSAEEDATMIREMMEAIGPDKQHRKSMADICRAHFPNRKPHQIQSRWLLLATPDQLVQFYGSHLLNRGARKEAADSSSEEED